MSGPRPTFEGYSLVDHRASPGLPADLAQKLGLDPRWVREGAILERKTLSCRHCRTTQYVNPLRTRARAACAKCNFGYVCDLCGFRMTLPDYVHVSWDMRVQAVMTGKPDPMAPQIRQLVCT